MFLLKLLLSNLLIVGCVLISKRWPGLGGLIATMPLTSLIVLIWLSSDSSVQSVQLIDYLRGVLWGIGPTVAFFAALLICLRKGIAVPPALLVATGCWLAGACVHRLLMHS